MINREKVIKCLNLTQNPSRAFKDETCFLIGICHVQLGNYDEAKNFFEKSILAMFQPRTLWKGTGQTDWLVNVCVLSGRADLYADVRQALGTYGLSKKDNLYLEFSNAVMEILLPFEEVITPRVERLLSMPKAKDLYASGLILQAILDRNQTGLDHGLEQLLQVHTGKAKHGELRWTPEGLLCMLGMSLAYLALKQGMTVDIANDYLNVDYLKYLSI